MRIIVLYGPPAVGKLTIAKELAKLTGYKIFHNHLALDLATLVHPIPSAFNYVNKLKLKIFRDAAKSKYLPGIIFTSCYTGDLFLQKVRDEVKLFSVPVNYVHLTASPKTLAKRVRHHSREHFNKIKDLEELKLVLQGHDFFKRGPFGRHPTIDTEKTKPKDAARFIVEHFKL